jgi:hypothetical protein
LIHAIFLVGEIKKIQVSTPKESKDPSAPKKNPSAVLLVQYGVTREATGNPVEFVNAVQVRVPSYLYPKIADKLKEGSTVQINGHLQGVFKTMMDDGYFTAELVADRVEVEGEQKGRRAE